MALVLYSQVLAIDSAMMSESFSGSKKEKRRKKNKEQILSYQTYRVSPMTWYLNVLQHRGGTVLQRIRNLHFTSSTLLQSWMVAT